MTPTDCDCYDDDGEGSIRQRTTSAEACAAVACSDDPRELVRVAFEHWDSIGWPEDKGPVSLLKRALELLSWGMTPDNAEKAYPCRCGRTRAA